MTKNFFAQCAIVLLAATNAMAADVYWGGDSGDFDWATGPWEDVGLNPVGVPVNGDTVRFRPSNGNNATIDINGAVTNLPNSTVLPQDNQTVQLWIYDSATLTPNSSPPANNNDFTINGGHASIEEAASAAQAITVNNINYHKKGNVRWYTRLNVIGDHRGPEDGSAWYFGDVNFGNDVEVRNVGWKSKVFYYGDYTVGTKTTAFRNDADSAENTFFGQATMNVNNQLGGKLHFNDLRVLSEFRQSNDALSNIGGRFSGNATYIRVADNAGYTGAAIPQINLLTGSTLAPGDSIGTLGGTALDVNMNTGANYEWEVGASSTSSTPGVGWDLSMANTFNIDGPLNFQIVELDLGEDIAPTDQFAVLAANAFDLADINLATDVNFSVVADQADWDISGAQLQLIQNYAELDGDTGNGFEDALVLSGISAQFMVPEPASIALWSALGLLVLAARHGRRKNLA